MKSEPKLCRFLTKIVVKRKQKHQKNQMRNEIPKRLGIFNKMVNQLPAEIKALWNSKDVPRREKTAMVNASVTKENGRYALQLDNPVINAMTETFSSVVGKERLVYFISKVSPFLPTVSGGFQCLVLFFYTILFSIFHGVICFSIQAWYGDSESLDAGQVG